MLTSISISFFTFPVSRDLKLVVFILNSGFEGKIFYFRLDCLIFKKQIAYFPTLLCYRRARGTFSFYVLINSKVYLNCWLVFLWAVSSPQFWVLNLNILGNLLLLGKSIIGDYLTEADLFFLLIACCSVLFYSYYFYGVIFYFW